MRRNPLRQQGRSGVALLCAALLLTLAGCDAEGSGGAAPQKAAGPSVIAPGKPGEGAATLSAGEAKKRLGDDSPNSADFDYIQMMIKHHAQALVMTALVPTRAGSEKVKRLAARVAASQKPEIGAMEGWWEGNGGPKHSAGTGHAHASMPGMATEAQLAKLRAARGGAFDELFLALMITHHEGAVTMAADALSEGNNVLVEEMANDVIAQQTAEIGRMRGLL
ncbi:DUF305 domain-containing protein [Streptomyces sp. NPDC127068]|uniref:DUF305 domain-containing protein n=1 Tax=Streptomyces sp. NPDC127068 TaxID=3347127 RepID=UPI00364C6914